MNKISERNELPYLKELVSYVNRKEIEKEMREFIMDMELENEKNSRRIINSCPGLYFGRKASSPTHKSIPSIAELAEKMDLGTPRYPNSPSS